MACGGVPPEQCRSEGTPSLGEGPDAGAGGLWLLWAFSKVTRCKSGTPSRRNRSNGYVPPPAKDRLCRHVSLISGQRKKHNAVSGIS
ncbi:hypothetical protein DWF74_21065 [Pseudomonas protegens]|nr:hypothetical protein DWF74_21065 [Pseudomonas protegens]